MMRPLISLIVFLTLLMAAPGYAQESSQELQVITTLADVIRPAGLFFSFILIIVVWIFLNVIKKIVTELTDVFAERRLLFQKILLFVQFIIYFATFATAILLSFDISKELLAIMGGTLAVAIGFAMKDLAASIVAGITIMFDRPFQVGDRVRFGGEYGDVINIGLRSVKLQTLNDDVVTIPNNVFLSDITASGNYGELDMQIQIEFFVDPHQDLVKAEKIIRENAALSKFIYLNKPIVVNISQVIMENFIAYQLTLKLYVLDTRYEKNLQTDITLRVKEQFELHGIKLPSLQISNERLRVS
ncbi:mechanosensitive ion channel family protein [Thalassotalea mangrovi]|uniref:Mechanosensitive ion channel n=1 Tax=Thalassotalea mangrovi TaxID=2572245 RepID=A0A4U1BAM1_9GAMM|nr:mechanosensitive ion channel domain-containing protein [Thalassotalea mangrovi]TKB47827.1 mechanosensitive ion channel [Thalassotalea mangrovi]